MSVEERWSRVRALRHLADRCPGFAMCRTDFLGTNICKSARERRFASYYPQGRLRTIRAICDGVVPFTAAARAVAESCTGCGICDKQCHFTAEIRPMGLFKAFRELAAEVCPVAEDHVSDGILTEFRQIVGAEWASDDPAHRIAYAGARSPLSAAHMPRYVALPSSTGEVAALVKACVRSGLAYVARGSGTSLNGAASEGLMLDMTRMDRIDVHPENWLAQVGAGTLAFDLQKKASAHQLRANVAEPAACVCANVITTNMHSLFSYSYGLGADHVVDAEFVDPTGQVTRVAGGGTNPFQYRNGTNSAPPGICTSMAIRLFPKHEPEEACLVPCASLAEATEIAGRLAERRIGIALGVLGSTYMAMFAGHTAESGDRIRTLLQDKLGIDCFILIVGHPSALPAVRDLADPVLDHKTIVRLLRALPHMEANPGLAALMDMETGEALFRSVFSDANRPFLTMTLESGNLSFEAVPEELQSFYASLYQRREMTDPVWLNTFRILPARMGRRHQFVSQIAWIPMRPARAASDFVDRMSAIARRLGLEGAFGYLTPVDHGTRAVIEFDFYFDQSIPEVRHTVGVALREAATVLDELYSDRVVACKGSAIVGQGMARYQSYLFGRMEDA